MTVFLLVVIGYLLVMLVLAVQDGDWNLAELIYLATWPVSIPLGEVWVRWELSRRTCGVCHTRWRTRKAMLAHQDRTHDGG